MNPQEIRERLAAILKEQEALDAKAIAEKRELSADEGKSYAALDAEYKTLSDRHTRMQERLARMGTLPAIEPASKNPAGNAAPIQVGRNLAEDDPKRGFKTPREFLDAVRRHRETPDADLPTDGLKILRSGARKFTVGSDEQSEGSGAYGGFLVPTAYTPTVLSLTPEPDVVGGMTRRIPMTAPSIEIPARVDKTHTNSVSGGLRVYRRGEKKQATASRDEWQKITLTAHMLIGLAYATEELLADSPTSFAALLATGFSDEFTSTIVDERINGNTAMQYTGVLHSAAKIAVAAEGAQPATTIVFKNIVKMRAQAYKYANCVWMCNHDCLTQLMQLNVTVGTGGGPVWVTSAVPDAPDTLFGRPLIVTEYCKTLGTEGDIMLINWGEYLESIYTPLQTDESIHVRFDYAERAFRFYVRCAGSPWWTSVLTPKNGATISPIVTLASRT